MRSIYFNKPFCIILRAAMAACPNAIPPSLAGTCLFNSTKKLFCFNNVIRRFVRKPIAEHSAAEGNGVNFSGLSRLLMPDSTRASATALWNFADTVEGGNSDCDIDNTSVLWSALYQAEPDCISGFKQRELIGAVDSRISNGFKSNGHLRFKMVVQRQGQASRRQRRKFCPCSMSARH